MNEFDAELEIIGINPFVYVPQAILDDLFVQAERSKSPIPICGMVNGKPYQQTLVRYKGEWRLYINLTMLDQSPKRVGETITVSVAYDPRSREIEPHPKLVSALEANPEAQRVYDSLPPSLQGQMVRYIARLKTEKSVDRNVDRAISFLLSKERFVGRELP